MSFITGISLVYILTTVLWLSVILHRRHSPALSSFQRLSLCKRSLVHWLLNATAPTLQTSPSLETFALSMDVN